MSIPNLDDYVQDLPVASRTRVAAGWQELQHRLSGWEVSGEFLGETCRVWAASEFVADSCLQYPRLLPELHDSGDLHAVLAVGDYTYRLAGLLATITDEAGLACMLRRFRRREMVRIAWRDLAGYSPLAGVVGDLSALADACIRLALEKLYDWHVARWGRPCNAAGEEQQLVVLGMGKLGARELNFSSDIDLIYAYAEEGETRDGPRSLSNQEFFIRLAQRLGYVLGNLTVDGFVFRVDTRLRPFGESSPLALSFDAMENYYQVHGREWERYALIKARVVAGPVQAGKELLALLKPFVYRRYVDFGAFEALREMKARINREVQRKGMEDNVKLGAGGIREVEFIGQAFQLIRGGREPLLRQREILVILDVLRDIRLLPDFVVTELQQAYVFLRTTEHRLQEYQDRQTHSLPEDEVQRERLAWSMGHAGWPCFENTLRQHMRRVHQHFEQVFAAPQTEHAATDPLDLAGVWQEQLDVEQAEKALQEAGFADPATIYQQLQQIRQGRSLLGMTAQGRMRLNQLMPLLLGAVGSVEQADATLPRLLHLLESIARRSAYLALLVENPMALSQLVRLCAASPWIASQLARHPLLLDELLDPRSLYAPPRRQQLGNELEQLMHFIAAGDQEAQMDTLRQFKQANTLRVAAVDVMDVMPLMVVSDHLTELAEVLLGRVLQLAWHHLAVQRYGLPECDGVDQSCGFAIIAYGKLGGIELGYGSDLDIVFLHGDGPPALAGGQAIDHGMLYVRLAQRIIHFLGTTTAAGVLYEADTRLRPSGSSGLLVSSLQAFADYQENSAWTWEHQALVRARGVAGDPAVLARFEQIRREILAQPREQVVLRREVREMRQRMARQLGHGDAMYFDLKQDPGGIADIEFMVQYSVLAWAHEYPSLLEYTDNIRLLEGLAAAGLLATEKAVVLADAYRSYRAHVHRQTLMEKPALLAADALAEQRLQVQGIWQELMG